MLKKTSLLFVLVALLVVALSGFGIAAAQDVTELTIWWASGRQPTFCSRSAMTTKPQPGSRLRWCRHHGAVSLIALPLNGRHRAHPMT